MGPATALAPVGKRGLLFRSPSPGLNRWSRSDTIPVMESFRYRHRVTYADCTVGNHVYYGRYLELLEAARGEWFRSLGKSFDEWHQGDGLIFPVLEVHLSYRSPARYDEVLTIELQVVAARGVRLTLGYRVVGTEGRLILEGQTLHVCTSLEDKPRRLPPALIASLGPSLEDAKGAEGRPTREVVP